MPQGPAPSPLPESAPVPARARRPGRPTAPPRRELRQQALAAAVFGLLGLLALSAVSQAGHALYLVAFALVIGAAACVLGVSAGRRARREDTVRPRGSVAAIILGAVSVVLALFAMVGIAFNQQLTSYEQCMNNAVTTAAQHACTQQLLHAVESR
jgi:predicted PurR-regulated permease PerM